MPKEHIYKIAKTLNFYRNSFRTLNRIGILLLFIVVGLLSYTIYQITSVPTPNYFATTSDGRLIELTTKK